jgi:RNA polymerase sigma factor (sigma-70 family)
MPERFSDINDDTLLQNFYSDKNNKWLGILLQRYTGMLLGVCMKYLKDENAAKDTVQQVFYKTINELHKYKVAYFKSWLYMIAKNQCLMQLRGEQKNRIAPIDTVVVPQADEVDAIEKKIATENNLTHLEKALTLLNKEQADCVTLFYLEKKSYQQIVESTHYNLLQVKSNIQNGKRNLKILMQQMINNER